MGLRLIHTASAFSHSSYASPKALLLHKGDKKDQIHTSVSLSSERWQDGGFRSVSLRRFVMGMVVFCRI